MRTCSVCGVEIDKTTAYTKTGEQKAQGRRCINCVEGASPEAPKVIEQPDVSPKAPEAPQVAKATASEPQKATVTEIEESESSTVKYAVGAVIVAIIIWLVVG